MATTEITSKSIRLFVSITHKNNAREIICNKILTNRNYIVINFNNGDFFTWPQKGS